MLFCNSRMVQLLNLQRITQCHKDEYMAAVDRVMSSGWFLQGEETRSFEAEYARYVGTSHCVAVANGLDALRLILLGYKEMGVLHDGDEVIVPANTYIATILAITESNLKPVLVEPTWESLVIDSSKIQAALTPRTRAVMTVHLYGRLAYNEQMAEICSRNNLLLLEDCAQSHGCLWQGRKTGSLGNAAAHSFYPGKNLGAFGDAGAVTTDDEQLADVVRTLANYGSNKKYVFKYEGINSRMSEMDAAVLRVKLRYLDEDNAHRRQVAGYYYANISNPLLTLPVRISDEENVYHQFPVFCERRDELQAHLASHGIQTMIHYPIPPHKQECYSQWNFLTYPITERIHAQELSLPMSQVVTEVETEEVVKAVNGFRI